MNKRKLLLWIATVCLLVALLPATVFAVTDGWSQNSNDTWSYYQGGEMVTEEVIEIGGAYYGFNWEGEMYADTSFSLGYYDETLGYWTNRYYCAREDGTLYVNQWHETEWGEWYYYGEDGVAAKDFAQIGGTWYFFDYEGRMIKNSLVWSDDYGAYYVISEDGTTSVQAPENGWASLNGTYYYMKNGQPIECGVYQIGGVWYGFEWGGRMYADISFGTDEYVEGEGWVYTYYRAKADGSLYVNEWYETEWGERYYYGEAGVAPDDFCQIGSTWYFFDEGRMITNQIVWSEAYQANYYIGPDGTTSQLIPENGWFYMNDETYYFMEGEKLQSGVYVIEGTYYGFNWEGALYTDRVFSFYEKDGEVYYRAKADGSLYTNEWYYSNEDAYYYSEGGAAATDFYQIGSTWYFFDYNGRMIKDQIVWSEIYQKSYIISADGTSSQEVPSNGWVYVGEDTYYMVDGQMVQNTSYQIDGSWYYFHWDGTMMKNGTLQTSYYDETLQRYVSVCYRAREGGILYANEWLERNGDWYYYGEGGKGYSDFFMVGGTWYFFQNARMVTDQLVWSDAYQAYYVISADGTSSKQVSSTGWVGVGEDWYYLVNGQMYSGGVYKIGGAYYGFDWSGRMRKDQFFSAEYYDGENYQYGRFRAKTDGTLVVNNWYQDGSDWYYFGQHGTAPNDFYKVGGTWYFFDYEGRMVTDQLVWSDAYQSYYVISVDGTSSKQVASTGWVQTSKGYYYIDNGEIITGQVRKIGGAYYGFDYSGLMYAGESFEAEYYDEAQGYWHWGYFRAKADGSLIVNNWYQSGSYWYYYGANAAGVRDFYKIGNTWYFFDYEGRMVTDELVWSDTYQSYYIISADGTSSQAVSDGWLLFKGDYYYISNNDLVTDEILQIGGAYYGFDWKGIMHSDGIFWMETYNGDYWEYGTYCARANGTLYVNSWYQEGDSWYYFGAAGKGAEGFVQLGGVWYYFSEGRMQTDTVIWDGDSECYYAMDENGVMIASQGWHTVNGRYVYAAAGGALAEGWKQIGGSWYYFYPQMAANELTEIDGVLYAFNNSGSYKEVTADGIYDVGYGKVYVQSKKTYTGWKQIGGSWYYFDPIMYSNDVYEIDGVMYVFDQNGKMFTGGWLYLGYNYYSNGHYVYADSQGRAYTGVKTIGGTKYVFNSWGTMYTDTTVVMDGVSYVVDKNGAVVSTTNTNGWKQIGGKYYYKYDGYFVEDEAMVIDGNLYAFDYDGVMITNRIVDTYVRNWGYEYMLLGANGAALKGWQKQGGQWVYADSNGFLANGRTTIGGSEYIFSNCYMKTGTFVWDEKIITTNASGAIADEKDMAAGWTYSEGTVYYYKNGEPYTGWVGDYYVNDGRMQVNTAIYDAKADCYYAVNTYGCYVKSGWYQRQYPGNDNYGDYYYAKAGGKLARSEWVQLGSTWYYFDHIYMVYDTVIEIDGELCKFDENGKYLGTVGAATGADGWKQVGSDWYYIHAGQPVTGLTYIDGDRYIFDYNGVMLSGGFVNYYDNYYDYDAYYYVGSNGDVQNYTGWKQIGGNWCYFNSSNQAVVGWFQDGGQRYYGDYYVKNGELYVGIVTGWMTDGEYLHIFNSSGAYQGTRGVENGWYALGNEWLYFENGKLADGYRVIGGVGYYFNGGWMTTNGTEYVNGSYCYFGSNGAQVTKAGWLKTAQGWIYVRANGTLCNGIWKIGGVEYYFMYGLMVR